MSDRIKTFTNATVEAYHGFRAMKPGEKITATAFAVGAGLAPLALYDSFTNHFPEAISIENEADEQAQAEGYGLGLLDRATPRDGIYQKSEQLRADASDEYIIAFSELAGAAVATIGAYCIFQTARQESQL